MCQYLFHIYIFLSMRNFMYLRLDLNKMNPLALGFHIPKVPHT